MATLQFDDVQVHSLCCDQTLMRRRFGPDVTRVISRRLQQLEAMASFADLKFLPFDYQVVDDEVEITINEDLVLVVASTQPTPGVRTMNDPTITIRALRTTSVATK